MAFCRAIGQPVAPFQKLIARAVIDGTDREVVAVLPRGSAKSTTAALIALHHVLTTPDPSVYIGAGSRDQARIIGRMVERLARHPALAGQLVVRHDELRVNRHDTVLMIVASDGGKAHGWERPTLMIGDEVWSWSDPEGRPTLLGAMQTALIKSRHAKLLLISTSASKLDSPLGRMRQRALGQLHVHRDRAFIDAHGNGLRWLEWSLDPAVDDLDDPRVVKRANPAPWITVDDLRQQHARVTAVEWAQFHCCAWGVGAAAWLPAGAWSRCRGPVDLTPREVVLAADIGGSRAASALVGVTPDDLQVPICEVFQGDASVLDVTAAVLRLRDEGWIIRELAYDPWRFASEALRLEREHGILAVAFPQSHARMLPASEGLHAAIVEGRLRHPGHADLDQHVANAVARKTGRGWRLDKSAHDVQIDAAVALAMATERAQVKLEPVRLLGWA